MKNSKYSEEQKINFVKRLEAGMRQVDLARETGISEKTLSRWKSKYSGLDLSEVKRLKHLEEENRRLKKLVADQALDNQILKEILGKY